MTVYPKRTIDARTARISYASFGDEGASPLIMIQGLGMPGTMWHRLGEQLAEEGFHVIIPDNRGTGASHNLKPMFLMQDLAEDIAAVHDHVFGASPAYVAGISLGGMITQRFALDHPERARGLVLAATTCGLPHNLINGAFVSPDAIGLLLKLCFTPKSATIDDMSKLLIHPDSSPRKKELFGRIREVFTHEPTPPATYALQLLAALFHSTGSQLHRIQVPVHVITGDSDHLIPSKNSDLLAAKLPNVKHTIVERAGHAFPLEHPRSFVDEICALRERAEAP